MVTAKAPDAPDFSEIRETALKTLSDIRERRINTVKALYEPLKFVSKENSAASVGVISSNIGMIHRLDSLLGVPADREIELIENDIE